VTGVVAVAVALGMTPWFAGAVVGAPLAARWGLSGAATAALAIAVPLGFVAGTAAAAVLNLADLVPARWYFVSGAVAAAAANAALLIAPGPGVAVTTRVLTGVALAAVYPPAMKMVSTWVDRGRGLAIGAIVGALTFGKALPYLLQWRAPMDDIPRVVLAASGGALAAAALVAGLYRDGPHAFPSRRFSWALVGTVAASRRWRAVTGGYLGHMWELYAFWTWVAAFVGASAASGAGGCSPRCSRCGG
jgi:MFS family permease